MLGGKFPRTRLFWMVAGVLVVILSVVSFYLLRPSAEPARASAAFSDFLHDIQAGRVSTHHAITGEARVRPR